VKHEIMKKNKQIAKQNTFTEFLLYTAPSGKVKVEIFLRDENLWLTQAKIAELFGVERSVVTKHLQNIFQEGELDKNSTCAKIAQVQIEGQRQVARNMEFYNLDAIISVGYRVNSRRATHFRIWATQVLKEYIIKGFAMDDVRLKNPNNIFGKDYFEEQLARIRDIRSSERRFYQKITDIYAQCSADYDPNEEITRQFFATVQNKLHWAITGQTAAEIIQNRVNSGKLNMGLTNWKNSPKGTIRKADVGIAKNYLNEKELDGLNRIVTMYLDYAEIQAQKGVVMYMKSWVEKLDAFLQFNEKEVLQDSGRISHEVAAALAESEYEKYRISQARMLESDFDREVKKLLDSKKERFMERYNPEVELAKGANLTVASYDKTQKILVTAGKVTVGGKPGIAEISGIATGKLDASIDGTINLWLSIFRYMRPDGTTDHVAGWNIALALKAKQTPMETAKAFAAYINAGTRPYKAKAAGNKAKATVTIVFSEK